MMLSPHFAKIEATAVWPSSSRHLGKNTLCARAVHACCAYQYWPQTCWHIRLADHYLALRRQICLRNRGCFYIYWRSFLVGVVTIRTLLLEGFIRAPDFKWEIPTIIAVRTVRQTRGHDCLGHRTRNTSGDVRTAWAHCDRRYGPQDGKHIKFANAKTDLLTISPRCTNRLVYATEGPFCGCPCHSSPNSGGF